MRISILAGDPDYMSVRCISWPDDEMLMSVERKGKRLPAGFVPELRYIFRDPVKEGVVTDCPYMFTESTMVLSERAQEVLGPILAESGEFIDVRPDHEKKYRLFVCYRELDALDLERVEYFPVELNFGERAIKRYAFKADVVEGAGIFRVKGLLNRLYASERFTQLVAQHRLSGFRIRQLWDGERGPLATFDDPGLEWERYPPGFGSTVREKRQAMRDMIAGRR